MFNRKLKAQVAALEKALALKNLEIERLTATKKVYEQNMREQGNIISNLMEQKEHVRQLHETLKKLFPALEQHRLPATPSRPVPVKQADHSEKKHSQPKHVKK